MYASDTLPWYRYGWPWFLIAVPAVSVALGVMMITLSLQTNNSLVFDDYYKAGKAINATIARDVEATRLGLRARIGQAPDGALSLDLDRSRGADHGRIGSDRPSPNERAATASGETWRFPDALSVRWVHVTRADLDGQALFGHVGGGRYVSPATALPTRGHWRVHVEEADGAGRWRLVSGRVALAPGVALTIEPSRLPAGTSG